MCELWLTEEKLIDSIKVELDGKRFIKFTDRDWIWIPKNNNTLKESKINDWVIVKHFGDWTKNTDRREYSIKDF
jgi:hypothetical protein